MPLDALYAALPAYARDLTQNLTALADDSSLSDPQKWGAMLACAHAIGVPGVIRPLEAHVADILTPEAVTAAKAASAIMGLNNIYYRSLHLMRNKDYETLPSKLRMNILRNPGVDKIDFELWCVAVSAVNGCSLCLDSHEKALRDHGVGALQVQTALRIASVIHAISAVVRAEAAAALA